MFGVCHPGGSCPTGSMTKGMGQRAAGIILPTAEKIGCIKDNRVTLKIIYMVCRSRKD
ncbi:MAG: hypothetical protein K0Q73_7782 [Paenibacillus sp.]|jgi:hypothetical protein|nr:hypothetical protein [Paenibacillus sp.]